VTASSYGLVKPHRIRFMSFIYKVSTSGIDFECLLIGSLRFFPDKVRGELGLKGHVQHSRGKCPSRRGLRLPRSELSSAEATALRTLLQLPLVPTGGRSILRVERDDRGRLRSFCSVRGKVREIILELRRRLH
jgi:hypothetical protein